MAFHLLVGGMDPDNGGEFTIEVDGPLFPGSTRVVTRYDFVRVTNTTTQAGAAIVRDRTTGAQVIPPIVIPTNTPPIVVDLTNFSVAQRTQNVIDGQWPAA